MSIIDISYLELWQPFPSVKHNHLCNFGRGHHKEHFCKIILNLDQWFRRRCRLKLKFTEGLMDEGQRLITIAHLELSAQVSLKSADFSLSRRNYLAYAKS